MKKQFNIILDFGKMNSEEIRIYFGEEAIINAIFRLEGNNINLSNPNYKVKAKVSTEYGGCQIYSGSFIEVVNPIKGLVKCTLPKEFLIPNEYSALFEIYDKEDDNTIYSGEVKIIIVENKDCRAEYFASKKDIETLKELDSYIRNANEILRELEERLHGK